MEGFVGGIPTPAVMARAAGPAGVGNGVGEVSTTDSTRPIGRVEGNGVVVGEVVSLQAAARSMKIVPVTANNRLRFTFYFSPYNTESFAGKRLLVRGSVLLKVAYQARAAGIVEMP